MRIVGLNPDTHWFHCERQNLWTALLFLKYISFSPIFCTEVYREHLGLLRWMVTTGHLLKIRVQQFIHCSWFRVLSFHFLTHCLCAANKCTASAIGPPKFVADFDWTLLQRGRRIDLKQMFCPDSLVIETNIWTKCMFFVTTPLCKTNTVQQNRKTTKKEKENKQKASVGRWLSHRQS